MRIGQNLLVKSDLNDAYLLLDVKLRLILLAFKLALGLSKFRFRLNISSINP
jgi:hypothetical protein